MKKLVIILVVNVMAINFAFSQGTAINTTGANADPLAMLDVSGTTSGVLINRMTATQKQAISSPATGLIIYQTNGAAGFYSYTGSAWAPVGLDNLGNHIATQILNMCTEKVIGPVKFYVVPKGI